MADLIWVNQKKHSSCEMIELWNKETVQTADS